MPGKLLPQPTPRDLYIQDDRLDLFNKQFENMAASDKEFGKFLSDFKKKYPELSKSIVDLAIDPKSTQEDIDRAKVDAKSLVDAFKKTNYNGLPMMGMFDYFGNEEFKYLTPEENKRRVERANRVSKHSDSTGVDADYSKNYNPNLRDYKSDGKSVVQYVNTDALIGAEGNEIREQDTVDSIAKDLEEGIGFKEPITVVVDPKNGKAFITEGNHRLAAARKAGVGYVPVRIVNSQDSAGNETKLQRVGKYIASRDKLDKIDENQDTILPSDVFDDSQLLPEDFEGFAQEAGGPKRQRVLEAIAAVSNALGLFDEWKGKTKKVREDVNNVGEFVNNMRYVKADLEKAIESLKNSKGVEQKMAAISELSAAIKKAKLAARIAKDRWKRNHPEDLKPKPPTTPKAIEAPTVEKVSKKFDDDLSAAEAIILPDSGQSRIPTGGLRMFDEDGNMLPQGGGSSTGVDSKDLDGFAQTLPTETVPTKEFESRKAKAIEQNKAAAAEMMKVFRERIANPRPYRQGDYDTPYSEYPAEDPMSAPVNPSNMPFNPSSEHQYSAINHHALAAAAAEKGFTDPRWMTALQAKKLGATVRKGEQGTQIMTFRAIENEDTQERVIVPVPMYVYNAEQMDGLEPYNPSQQPKMNAAQALEFVLSRFTEAEKKRGRSGRIKIYEDLFGFNAKGQPITPYWDPGETGESIRLPDRSKYDSPEDYLYSLFHELAHATGTRQRQGREAHLAGRNRTDAQTATEEATAEIASQLLLQRLGLPTNPARTAEYLKSHRISDAQLTEAMTKAELAVDFVLGNDVLPPWINSSTDMMEEANVPGYTPPTSRSWNPNTNLGPQDAPPAYPPGTPGTDENPEITGFAQKPGKPDRTGKKSVTDSKTATEKVMAGLLEKIRQGETPWRKTYKEGEKYGGFNLPRNPASKHIYSGVNAMALRFAQEENGYSDPRWMTYKQAEQMGGQVRKGEKGTFILVPMRIVQKDEKDPSKSRSFTMFKAMAVFNAEQIDGLSLPELSTESLPKMTPLDAQDFIVERYKKAMAARTGKAPNIKHTYVGAGGAHQTPSWGTISDDVTLPNLEQFESPEDLFETITHELVHSTGHPDRLDRSDLTKDYANDLASRAKEELIAEIGAALLANMFGVDSTFDNNAAYVQSWLKHLKSNPDEIVNATSQAQKAVDYILGTDLGDWSPIDGYSIGNAVQKPTEESKDEE